MLGSLLFATTCFLAYANGANDNFKGVASLFGSETADYRAALRWGTATTLLGSTVSIYLAQSLVAAFTGKGLVPDQLAAGEPFLMAIAAGAGGTVMLASLLGFPISTTHALVGAIIGAGLATAGTVNVRALSATFVAPLLLSPVAAVFVAGPLYLALHRTRRRVGITDDTCVCVHRAPVVPALAAGGAAVAVAASASTIDVEVDRAPSCARRYHGQLFGIAWQQLIDWTHYLSAGMVSFARGLNDTPKIAALLLVQRAGHIPGAIAIVGSSMALGALLSARRVAHTMGRGITTLNHGQGLAANVTTGLLVIGASRLGLPVSTTHVSVGALFGIGIVTRQSRMKTVRGILLSWLVTLPCAAVVAGITYALVEWIGWR